MEAQRINPLTCYVVIMTVSGLLTIYKTWIGVVVVAGVSKRLE